MLFEISRPRPKPSLGLTVRTLQNRSWIRRNLEENHARDRAGCCSGLEARADSLSRKDHDARAAVEVTLSY